MTSSAIKNYLPWVVATALFMEQLDATIVNTAIPSIAASLHVTPLSLKSVVTSYILSLAVGIPVSGWMADRYGTRRVFGTAIAIFTLASVLCGLSLNAPMMTAARLLQGIGGAMMMPVGRLAIIRTFPKSELLGAMNFVIIPALIGPLLGPTVGGLIVHWVSWRAIFFVNVPVGLAALFLVYRYMPDYRGTERRPLDVIGMILFSCGTALLSWLLEIFGEHTLDPDHRGRHAGAVDRLAGGVWLARERDRISPAAAGAVPDPDLPRFGAGRLRHAPRRRRAAVPAALAVPDRARPAGVEVGPADDADRAGRDGHEAGLGAAAGALRLPPGADRQHGVHRHHDRHVCAGEGRARRWR